MDEKVYVYVYLFLTAFHWSIFHLAAFLKYTFKNTSTALHVYDILVSTERQI